MRKSDKELPLAETASPADLAASPTMMASEDSAQGANNERGLEKGTVVAQRYVVERELGRGGMGTVYLARDTTLGRDVALKLHRHGSSHERLYREAVAMAQLSHPNVVTVYEVGTLDDQLFVAMEYVRGSTLTKWAEGKSWRAIALLLLDVGEGLVAAHAAGFVHRDFKPENVLVGSDGRPRVSDFGLARSSVEVTASLPASVTPRSSETAIPISVTPSAGPMTVTGALLGTPAYMSPEQYAAGTVGARSDQFSFCVAAWEVLYGHRPFAGETLPQVQQAIERGKLVVPETTRVPAAIRRVLARGLAADPDDRWPDMAALLHAFRRAASPRAQRTLLAAGGIALLGSAAAAAAWFATRTDEHRAPAVDCSRAGAELEQLFPPALRDQALAKKGSPDENARIQRGIDGFVASYRDAAASACKSFATRDWSQDLYSRSQHCREGRLRDAAAAFGSQLRDVKSARVAFAVVGQLGELADLGTCRDAGALAGIPDFPDAQREALQIAHAELLTARRDAPRDRVDEARATLARIASSPIGTSPHLTASLALVRAAIARVEEKFDDAIREATDAYYKAHAAVDQPTEIEALTNLLYWIGTEKQDNAAVESWYRLALAEVDRFARFSPLRTAQLRLALVGVAVSRDEMTVAVEQARTAMLALDGGPPLLAITATREYAAALAESGDHKRSVPMYKEAVRLLVDTLGPNDIQVAELMADEALTMSEVGMHEEAVGVVDSALAVLAKHPEYKGVNQANVATNLAAVLSEAGDDARAEPLLVSAREVYARELADTTMLATIDSNLATIDLHRKNFAAAIKRLESALALTEKTMGATHSDAAVIVCNLAEAHRDANALGRALAYAKRCVDIRARVLPNSEFYIRALVIQAEIEARLGDHEAALRDASASLEASAPHLDRELIGRAKLVQGRAMLALGRDRETAKRLLGEARALFADLALSAKVDEIDALLR